MDGENNSEEEVEEALDLTLGAVAEALDVTKDGGNELDALLTGLGLEVAKRGDVRLALLLRLGAGEVGDELESLDGGDSTGVWRRKRWHGRGRARMGEQEARGKGVSAMYAAGERADGQA